MEVEVNYVGVLLAAVSTMVVGSIWYAKSVFGETWRKLVKLDEKQTQDGAVKAMSLTFLASLVTAYVLAHVSYLSQEFFDISYAKAALQTAVWVWLGFTAARILTHDLFEARPTKLTVMNLAHELLTFLVMGGVLGLLEP